MFGSVWDNIHTNYIIIAYDHLKFLLLWLLLILEAISLVHRVSFHRKAYSINLENPKSTRLSLSPIIA